MKKLNCFIILCGHCIQHTKKGLVLKERPGTHRYVRLGEDVVSWHFLDQVIIRPSVVDKFKFESLRLCYGTENYSYLNSNHAPTLSDHLPIMCELEY